MAVSPQSIKNESNAVSTAPIRYCAQRRGPRLWPRQYRCHPTRPALSLNCHFLHSEHWIVVEGTARVTLDGEVSLLTENRSIYIPVGAQHRNPGRIPTVFIEVQTGSYVGRMTSCDMRIETCGGETRPAPHRSRSSVPQFRRLSGTIPPFFSSSAITALWSAIFCSAEPWSPAWTLSSSASSLRAARLESRSSSLSKSTIDDW